MCVSSELSVCVGMRGTRGQDWGCQPRCVRGGASSWARRAAGQDRGLKRCVGEPTDSTAGKCQAHSELTELCACVVRPEVC